MSRKPVNTKRDEKRVPKGVTFFPTPVWVMLEGSDMEDHKGEVWIQIDDGKEFLRYRVTEVTP